MNLIYLLTLLMVTNVYAGREMMAIQAYELNGGNDANGHIGATISILNVSKVTQTVSWEGGFYSNRNSQSNSITTNGCSLHAPLKPINRTVQNGSSYEIAEGGFITLWCSTDADPTSTSASAAGGEGVLKIKFFINEERGAISASGAIYIMDRGTNGGNKIDHPNSGYPHNAAMGNYAGWGDQGSGPFTINGGRAF